MLKVDVSTAVHACLLVLALFVAARRQAPSLQSGSAAAAGVDDLRALEAATVKRR